MKTHGVVACAREVAVARAANSVNSASGTRRRDSLAVFTSVGYGQNALLQRVDLPVNGGAAGGLGGGVTLPS